MTGIPRVVGHQIARPELVVCQMLLAETTADALFGQLHVVDRGRGEQTAPLGAPLAGAVPSGPATPGTAAALFGRALDLLAEPSTRIFRSTYTHALGIEYPGAARPGPVTALAVVEGFRAQRGWELYRPEGFHQLRSALNECDSGGVEQLPVALSNARTRARHRGRHVPPRTVGTTLLVKGLEFDHGIVLEADTFSRNELYVAITRASSSLRIVSKSRTIAAA